MTAPIELAAQRIVLLYSVVLHEVSHCYVARALGDPTAERVGRLTLNPIKHLDLFGSFVLPLFLVAVGSPFLFGYAKPVPYNPQNLRNRRWGPVQVALAGPLTNIMLALLFSVLAQFMAPLLPPLAQNLLWYAVIINLVLAAFNLFPVPPLDGHWLLMAVLATGSAGVELALYRYQWLFLILILFFVFPRIIYPIQYLTYLLTGYIPG